MSTECIHGIPYKIACGYCEEYRQLRHDVEFWKTAKHDADNYSAGLRTEIGLLRNRAQELEDLVDKLLGICGVKIYRKETK